MTKKDLKTGMRVTLRNNEVFVALINAGDLVYGQRNIMLMKTGGWMGFDCYNEDLTYLDNKYDIIKIESPIYLTHLFYGNNDDYKVVWTREEPAKEMTVEEVQTALGYKIKIIENKKEESH